MDKNKQIIVKENGKVIRKYPDQLLHSSNRESAATLQESDDDPVQTFERKMISPEATLKKSSKFTMFKPILIAISSAIAIGLVLSVIMFQVLIDVEDGLANQTVTGMQATNGNQLDEEEVTNQTASDGAVESSSYTLEPLQAFVLQAGVFSEKENAEVWADNFSNIGLPSLIWQRGEQYFLLIGLADSKEQAGNIVNDLDTGEYDLFVKEWSTTQGEVDLTEQEQNWLVSFQQTWQENISKTDNLSKDNWGDLPTNKISESEKLSAFVNSIENMETLNGIEAQQHLLQLMYEYELLTRGTGSE
ncbi:SPOR domain-containing protein [Oceanobacillus salinisoli]|uniref:SPOR domain-containing protein n=1 Tax=Oceanobacillus salinisoli TaxID=2678611 RepID=UPI0012E2AE07|nr:SPOR domain-containing protein [Oceanobacillus salinisoli]